MDTLNTYAALATFPRSTQVNDLLTSLRILYFWDRLRESLTAVADPAPVLLRSPASHRGPLGYYKPPERNRTRIAENQDGEHLRQGHPGTGNPPMKPLRLRSYGLKSLHRPADYYAGMRSHGSHHRATRCRAFIVTLDEFMVE
ncbi:hypothetical protein AAE478_001956 [Parahypoxylon ruwenzoriense]